VAVDAHPKTASQFQTPCNELYLACSTLVYPPVPRKFKGVFSGTLDANPIDAWLDQLTETRGRLLAAGTVTSTALDLAVHMGCDPVVSIGFDLSLANDGTTHAQNTMYHQVRANPDDNELVRVPGNYQDTVITTPQFKNYLILLEKYIARNPTTRFIDVTGAGAKVTGMTLAPTASLAEFSAAPFDAAGMVANLHQSFRQDYSATVGADLDDHIIRLDKAANTARRAARICNELMMLPAVSRPDDLATMERLCGELETADHSFQELQASSFLLEMSLWPVCYWLTAHKADGGAAPAEVVATYKRWREFYEQIAGAALWTRDVIKQVMAGIRAIGHNSEATAQRQ
jgi:hypothetical protein